MSQENVERFLTATDAFNRRDLKGWLELYAPDAVFEPLVSAFEGSFVGHDGLQLFFTTIGEDFDEFRVEFDDVRDLGDRVLALGTAGGRGKGSGLVAGGPLGIVASFREGKCVHFKDYGDRELALKAAGLSD
jgi:ketosteroid isomerase-like protein